MIKDLKNILETLRALHIKSVCIDPLPEESEDEGILIRAASDNADVVVFDASPCFSLSQPIGIQSVSGLYARLDLFDVDKASIELKENNSRITGMVVKQGRRNTHVTFANPKKIAAPKTNPFKDGSPVLAIKSEDVKRIDKAISALLFTGGKQNCYIRLVQGEGGVNIEINDGDSDSFHDMIDGDLEGFKGEFDVDPFKRCMLQSAAQNEGDALLQIDHTGICNFDVGYFCVMIPPKIH